MSKNVTEKIKDKAFELLKDNPDGLRYSELVKFISENDEKLNRNTINGSIWNLDSQFPEKVYKPSRGLFRLIEFKDPETDELRKEVQPKEVKKIKEEDFYEPFSNWLQNDIEDVTHSIPLGGNRFNNLKERDSSSALTIKEMKHLWNSGRFTNVYRMRKRRGTMKSV